MCDMRMEGVFQVCKIVGVYLQLRMNVSSDLFYEAKVLTPTPEGHETKLYNLS